MDRLSENYYLRKCYLEKNQVPTQSVIKKTMTPSLAKVFFKSMTHKHKVLAGLEPVLKGGGYDWYAPPEDLLKGRTVLKPLKKEFLSKLGFRGLEYYGEIILQYHFKRLEEEKQGALLESDIQWKKSIEELCKQQTEELSKKAAQKNSDKIRDAFHEFTMLYTTSINKIESLLLNSAIAEIERVKEEAFSKMSNHYKTLLKQQATMLYDRYTEKLEKKKSELKEQFISKMEQSRMELGNKVHDINVEKHITIEKLRQLLECQNLACQIYVAMKEKQENEKLLSQATYEHKKILKLLTKEVARKDVEIKIEIEKEERRERFQQIWREKVFHVVKKFHEFISYSLHTLPEQADFLLNIEKLMLLQISEILENPNAESLFEPEKEEFHTPVPELRPFYIFGDDGSKVSLDRDICPKPYRSSSSHLPVLVVNKTCIYAACDNLQEFADKMEHFFDIVCTKEPDLTDSHDYTYDVPVQYRPSEQLLELKEQSSVMQILQKEMPNTKNVRTECLCPCKLPYCFCHHSLEPIPFIDETKSEQIEEPKSVSHQKELPKDKELVHIREPKWESYFKFMKPKTCQCAKVAKKTLQEHLPAYMRNMSTFDYPDLPNYEPCSLRTLKSIVKRAKGKTKPVAIPKIPEPTKRDVETQYSDIEFEYLCSCFDAKQARSILNHIMKAVEIYTEPERGFNIDGSLPSDYLIQPVESFVKSRALSLSNLMKESPELKEIFKKQKCPSDIEK
ncbi:hypothetical protein RR48_09609 [Papilio machaon]|uniref:Uncharacterized protein n=1 Tax=Papilio machaon TaxID=76193 RepID=A0A194QZS0_PAPMA|nr:hypothetical protein RR48_09609 [Papilio machaon]